MSKRISVPLPTSTDVSYLELSRDFNYATLLTSHEMPNYPHSEYDALMAFGAEEVLQCSAGNALAQLQDFHDHTQDWLFGCLAYDLKNEVEPLTSTNFDGIGLPDLLFYQPKYVVTLKDGTATLHCRPELVNDFLNICKQQQNVDQSLKDTHIGIHLTPRISKQDYLAKLDIIQHHIQVGDCYELNFCQEFYAEGIKLNPYQTHRSLSKSAQAPFMAFFKTNSTYLMCSSPERFLKRTGDELISQPIKGTAKRGKSVAGDLFLKKQLEVSHKDQTENVMIVDLVRNDLGRIALPGTVKVQELFGVYTFPHVHQMISTIKATAKPGLSIAEILRHTFPMGSMTGAPKFKVMQLVEAYEQTKRGWYSGAVGYITPTGDFDFNVVIRSLLYNAESEYLSCQVGGGITAGSIPEKEYEECLVKIEGIQKVLNNTK